MQAIIIARAILQQQGRRSPLSRFMAPCEKFGVIGRKARRHPHPFVPAIGDRCEPRIEHPAQRLDQRRQRIGEIAIFAAPEAVPRHNHMAAKLRVLGIKCRSAVAIGGVQQPRQHRPSVAIKRRGDRVSIRHVDMRADACFHRLRHAPTMPWRTPVCAPFLAFKLKSPISPPSGASGAQRA